MKSAEEDLSTETSNVHKEKAAYVSEPPDGGYGWVIVAASFLCIFVTNGWSFSFGILLMHLIEYYNASKAEIAWAGSVFIGCALGIGPLCSAIVNKFGARPVAIVGSLIATIGLLLSTIAPNVKIFIFTYGAIGGVGSGFIFLPSVAIVGHYFTTKRGLATGLIMCGTGTGFFVFPPLVNFLLEFYDWKGTIILSSGMFLNCIVLGALMRPLHLSSAKSSLPHANTEIELSASKEQGYIAVYYLQEEATDQNRIFNVNDKQQFGMENFELFTPSDVASQPDDIVTTFKRDIHHVGSSKFGRSFHQSSSSYSPQLPNKDAVLTNDGHQHSSLGNLNSYQMSHYDEAIKLISNPTSIKVSQKAHSIPFINDLHSSLSCKNVKADIEWSVNSAPNVEKERCIKKSLRNSKLKDYLDHDGHVINSCELQNSKTPLNTGISQTFGSAPHYESSSNSEHLNETKIPYSNTRRLENVIYSMKEALGISLLTEVQFLIVCFTYAIATVGIFVPFLFFPLFSISRGIDQANAALLLSAGGFTQLLGIFVFGYIADIPKFRALCLNNVCLCAGGITALLTPFCYSYTSIIFMSIVYSFFSGGHQCLPPIVLVEIMGLKKLNSSFGLINLCRGVGCMMGSPIAGAICDFTGNYDGAFYITGATLIGSASLMMLIPWITSRQGKKFARNVPALATSDCPTSSKTINAK